MYPVLN